WIRCSTRFVRTHASQSCGVRSACPRAPTLAAREPQPGGEVGSQFWMSSWSSRSWDRQMSALRLIDCPVNHVKTLFRRPPAGIVPLSEGIACAGIDNAGVASECPDYRTLRDNRGRPHRPGCDSSTNDQVDRPTERADHANDFGGAARI